MDWNIQPNAPFMLWRKKKKICSLSLHGYLVLFDPNLYPWIWEWLLYSTKEIRHDRLSDARYHLSKSWLMYIGSLNRYITLLKRSCIWQWLFYKRKFAWSSKRFNVSLKRSCTYKPWSLKRCGLSLKKSCIHKSWSLKW